jgi:putative transposase
MARLPRLYFPGCAQHVIQRGNNRMACFHGKTDYTTYLAFLEAAAAKYEVAIHAFVLMTNHVHLLVTPADEQGVSRMMQAQGRKYVRYFNHTHGRTGTLWEGRYKSTLVDADNYLLTVYRYIELNPVRAHMVSHPSQYRWSSYAFNALGKPIQLVTPHLLYLTMGATAEERQEAYRALFRGRIPEKELTAIRETTNKGWVLGCDRFKHRIEAETGRRTSSRGLGGDRRSEKFRNGVDQLL